MTVPLNETHDPARRSFVESANAAELRFPDPEPAVRRVPPGARGDRRASAWRSATRSSTSPPRRPLSTGVAADAAARVRRARTQSADGARPAGLVGACGWRCRAALSADAWRAKPAPASRPDGAGRT